MSIREYKKDQLTKHAGVELVQPPLQAPVQDDHLIFWTEHPTENFLVDLTRFVDGEYEAPLLGSNWKGPFTGRPQLITQLAPAIQASLTGLAKETTLSNLCSLRAWWRLLDAVEAAAEQEGQPMDRVEDVRQLTEIHRQWAHKSGMRRGQFMTFVRKVNLVLAAMRAPELHWVSPEDPDPKRHLPPENHLKVLRIALKQEWLKTHVRWKHAGQLRLGEIEATTEEDARLLSHYRYYERVQKKLGKKFLTAKEIAVTYAGYTSNANFCTRTGLKSTIMKDGWFPNRWDVNAAFHQCLSVTGWNPSTLLTLDATIVFLLTHPKDDKRFMLTPYNECDGEPYELIGNKARAGGAEQRVFGLWKTSFGAGYIIKALLARTAPLRAQLQEECNMERARYAEMQQANAPTDALNTQYLKVQQLLIGCRSVWLYYEKNRILWLGKSNFRSSPDIDGKPSSYLTILTQRINSSRAEDEQIEMLNMSDLRDAFALWVWRSTGGNILAVMKALQHRWIKSTVRYVDNNIINDECNQQYQAFTHNLFGELSEGRLDVAILAHLCRYGKVTEEQWQRLEEYRMLMRSRCGVACKDPHHPPRIVAPAFMADGKHICPTQRCTLCKVNSVLLPESVNGISMRVEELLVLQARMPVETWLQSMFQKELDNTLDALQLFDSKKVLELRAYWSGAIAAGRHLVPGLPLLLSKAEKEATNNERD